MYSRALKGLKFHALPWHFWASQAPQCLVVSSLLSSVLSLPREKGSHSASSPVTWTSCTPPGTQPNRFHFPSLPAREITQTGQSHPPMGTRVTSPSCHYKACLPQALLVHSALKCGPMWPSMAGGILPCPRLWVCDKVLVSSVQCKVFCIWPSQIF